MNFYSATTKGFYPENKRSDYEKKESWPDDAIEMSEEAEAEVRKATARGDIIAPDGAGGWTITPAPAPPFAPFAAAYLDMVRAIREQILNRLAGIGFAALLAADTATAQAVATARQALLDITTAPAVLAATDAAGLKAAVLAAYGVIVAAAPAALVTAFDAEGL